MPLSKDNFYKSDGVHLGADGITRDCTTYSYIIHSTLHDVIIIEGMKFYRVNFGQLSNIISAIKPIHYEIENHFGI